MAPDLVLHGHFYQPPRENPWTEEVPRQPGAAPFHDWNERVSAESYRPNGAARIVDERGRVVAIVNNFASLSFDVGPTLLSWLEEHDPTTYSRMLAGDRRGGGAMAQAFGHLILPLASERDVRTQVRWGLADFAHRFGRPASGMWLPETAVNDAVLAVLAEEGVAFTILAPGQAARVRPVGGPEEAWTGADPAQVAGRVYRWFHPDDRRRSVDLLFYDGPLSHAIAFELSTLSSQALVDRIVDRGGDAVVIAADGETFGHHHRYGDRLVAYALAVDAPRREVGVSTANALLARGEVAGECEVHESAWSCAHGVGRWRVDCGCSTGGEPGWDQRWRAPLRDALEIVKSAADEVFERRGKEVLRDPWDARDRYVDVLIGASEVDAFVADHVVGDQAEDVSDALALLEAERHSMSMFTSCGWFFNDLAGIETVQVLRYAARVLDLLDELGEDAPRGAFLDRLGEAASNDPREGTGADIWARHVLPARVTPERVAAHVALVELLQPDAVASPPAYALQQEDHDVARRGPLTLVTGRTVLTHHRTRRRTEHVVAALHVGGLEVIGVVRRWADDDRERLQPLRELFRTGGPVTAIVRLLGALGGEDFDLSAALPGRAEEILEGAAFALAERFAGAYDRLFEDHRTTLEGLAASGYPLPPVLRAPAELSLARRLEAEVVRQAGSVDPAAYAAALAVADEARAAGVSVDTPSARALAGRVLVNAVTRAVDDPEHADDAAAVAAGALSLARDLGLHPDLEQAQELVYEAMLAAPTPALRTVARRLGLAVDSLGHPT